MEHSKQKMGEFGLCRIKIIMKQEGVPEYLIDGFIHLISLIDYESEDLPMGGTPCKVIPFLGIIGKGGVA